MKNFKSPATASKQKGFSLLTGFILVIVLFGALAFFLAGRGINTAFGTTYANNSKASNLIAQAAYLRTGFDSVILAGTAPVSVTFDDAATTGIFNIDTGAATTQQVDPAILAAPAADPLGFWVFGKNNGTVTSVGTTAADYTIIVGGLKQGICQQINTTLNGTNIASAPEQITATDVDIFGGATSASPVVSGAATVFTVPAAGRASGCYQTDSGAGSYVFIQAVYPQ